MITGIHHIALRCHGLEQYNRAVHFYCDLLGLKMYKQWGGGDACSCMLNTGAGCMEIFSNGTEDLPHGKLQHVAFATDNVDELVEKVRAEGFEITHEPADVVIPTAEGYPVRVAFCIGAAGEEVEFFTEK
jgi:glyoxylase I family protein